MIGNLSRKHGSRAVVGSVLLAQLMLAFCRDHVVGRLELGDKLKGHVGFQHDFVVLAEHATFEQRPTCKMLRELRRDADDGMAAPVVAEPDRRGQLHVPVPIKFGQDAGRDQRDRRRLQVDRTQHQLRLAAGRADYDGEFLGRAGAASGAAPGPGPKRDAERHRQSHQQRCRQSAHGVAAKICQDQRPGIHGVVPAAVGARLRP